MCSCSQKFPCGSSQGHAIVNYKICQILQPDFKFESGSRNSKSSPRRVPRETRASKLSVAFQVFSDRKTERNSSIHVLTRSKDLSLSEIKVLNALFCKVY